MKFDRIRDLARSVSAVRNRRRAENRRLVRAFQSCGKGVELGRNVRVSHPKWVCIGNRVRVGNDVSLETEGGLTVGHGTRIARGVTIRTTTRSSLEAGRARRPVLIGKGVSIGRGACIEAGSRIGNGAIIGADAVIDGDVRDGVAESLERAGSEAGARFVFVPSTGRSGTTTIARLLSRHPQIRCRHERRLQLIRLSTELAHGIVGEEDAEAELDAIYRQSGVYRSPIYGESDHRLFNLIGILARLLPASRFVWLIRDGRDVVASTVARGWYDAEFRSGLWGEYRLRGDRCGDLEAAEWETMTQFEKNCWYWAYVNRTIGQQLEGVAADRWMALRLEDLASKSASLFEFLGVDPVAVGGMRENTSRRTVVPPERWDAAERAAFDRWCGETMDRWYPGWRASS